MAQEVLEEGQKVLLQVSKTGGFETITHRGTVCNQITGLRDFRNGPGGPPREQQDSRAAHVAQRPEKEI